MAYKRNQIEEAIARLFDPKSEVVPVDLRTRIKRLFELDRFLGRSVRSKDPELANYAFFSDDAPGTGADISFSEYDAFALLNGLRLMAHGWPQGFAVSIMRMIRAELENEHARILKQNPDELFDERAIRKKARPGDIAVDNIDPVFLTLVSKTQGAREGTQIAPTPGVCRGALRVSEFARAVGASSMSLFEVATLAHQLHVELRRTEPRRRGRA